MITLRFVIASQKNTGKSLSEALIFASTNPQYDDRLFIDLKLLTHKNTNLELEHVVYKVEGH